MAGGAIVAPGRRRAAAMVDTYGCAVGGRGGGGVDWAVSSRCGRLLQTDVHVDFVLIP